MKLQFYSYSQTTPKCFGYSSPDLMMRLNALSVQDGQSAFTFFKRGNKSLILSVLFMLLFSVGAFAQNPLWGIKDYTNLGYFSNTTTYPWTWTNLATLSGGNYCAAASIQGGKGILFNQTTRVFHLVNTTTGALTALTTTNAGSVPRSLNYNVASYDPITSRLYIAHENSNYGHIYSVNIAGNSVTFVSEKAFGQSFNSDDWTFLNGKLIGIDGSTVETWDVVANTYVRQALSAGPAIGEIQGSWANTDGTIGFYGESNNIYKYNISTNTTTLVGTSSTSFSNGGEPHDLANLYFGVTVSPLTGAIGVPYTGAVAGVGGTSPYTYALTSGTLPTGLSFNAATGAITGTPTTKGLYTLTFQATDSNTPTNLTTTTTQTIEIDNDTDGDGILNSIDIDDDNDGITDAQEVASCSLNLVTNGNFETGNTTGWSITRGTIDVVGSGRGGGYAIDLEGCASSTFRQTITTETGKTYRFSFWYSANTPPESNTVSLIEGTAGAILASTTVTSNTTWNTTNFVEASLEFTATSTQTTIQFYQNPPDGDCGGIVLDDVSVTGVFCDSDGDNVSNQLDLDSDNDGCSDAYEGGATIDKTANFKFSGAVGANGLADVLETVVDNGTVNYRDSYSSFAINAAKVKCSLLSPGGVVTGLAWWFEGDAGVTTSGTAVTKWSDQSPSALDVTQATASRQPTNARYQNFNKVMTFDGSDALNSTIGFWGNSTGNTQYNVYAVTKHTNGTGSVNTLFAENTSASPQILFNEYGGNMYMGTWGGYSSYTPFTTAVSGTPLLITSRYNTTGNVKQLSWNGKSQTMTGYHNGTTAGAFNGNNSNFTIGNYIDQGSWPLNGDIAEIAMYSSDLTATQRQQVESYLAIKWGVSLDQTTAYNYLNSAGATIWDATANSAYKSNIIGIGRDDTEGLNQKQSKSINAGFQPVIGNGTGIAATNAANVNTFSADKTYELIGDNGLNGTYSVAYAPSSFSPPSAYYRMNRIWKVQETGTVGTVTISVPSGPDRLLVSNTDAFTPGGTTQEIVLTADGSGNMTAQVDLVNGDFFSFGRMTTAPGGVVSNGTTSLAWWYKGDAGVSTSGTAVTQWNDQSLSALDVVQATIAKQPTATSYQNFNPVVTFASNKALNNAAGYWKNSTANAQYNVFAVAKHTYGTGSVNTLFTENTNQAQQTLFFDHGANMYMGFWGTYSAYTPFTAAESNIPLLVSSRYNTTGNVKQLSWNGKAKTMTGYHNGTNTATFNGNNSNLVIGNHTDQGSWPFEGEIAEIFMYPFDLTATQRQQVQSYMAIKWGMTLDQTTAYNYLNSAGAIVWDATANSSYKYNITGIGVDAAADLNQKQSKSINSGVQPVIGLGSIVATNAANASGFTADKSFMLLGSDAGVAKFYTAITAPVGNEANNRFTRIWKVQETGTVGTIQFAIPSYVSGGNTIYLVRSTDATFDATDTWTPLSTTVTVNNMAHSAAHVDFNNGDFFTLATYVGAPGCVAANLNFWLKADAIGEEDGVTLAEWENQAISTLDSVGQATATARPTYYETNQANLVNFNPSVSFDGGDELTQNARMFPATSAFTQIALAVDRRTNTGELRAPMGGGFGNGNVPNLDFQTDGNSPQGFNPYSVDGEWVNTSPTYRLNSLGLGATNQSGNIVGLTTNNIVGGSDNIISYVNGTKENTTISANQNATFGNGMYVGSSADAEWLGLIPEVLVYDKQLSDAEMQRVYSYLAIKYGVSLKQFYVNSTGATIYDTTGYANNIAGIGREVCQTLNQKQSRSMLAGVQPTIGLTTIETTNVGNNAALADGSFMIWGSNTGTASFSTTITGPGGVIVNNRFTRIWKVQETGTVGTVKFAVPQVGTGETVYLLRSTDATFDATDTWIPLSNLTVGSTNYLAGDIDFNNGDYFTLATFVTAPGGVLSTLEFWYRPDAGVTLNNGKVSSWVDQANGIEVTPAAAANGPSYFTTGANAINFNPTLNFTNATRQDGLRANTGLSAIPTGVSTFSVLMPDDASNRWFFQWGVSGSGYYNNYGSCTTNNLGVWTNSHGGCVNSPTTMGPITTPSFLSSRWNNTVGTNQWQLRQNGQLHSGTTTATALNVPSNTALEIGDVNTRTAGNEYVGNISEVIGYTSRLSDIDRQKVESYISIKYGITYMNDANTNARDYLNTAGTAIWSTSTNTGYNNNIAGIAKDIATALNQKQSKSVNAGIQPVIGLGTIDSLNAANPSVFAADASYMVWGSDAGVASFGTGITPVAGFNANNRMTRIWKVQETGTVGTVKFAMPSSISNGSTVYLIRSTDATFDGTDNWIPLSNLTVGATTYLASDIDFANGDYFTVATYLVAPGGVAANLERWFKADAGTTVATGVSQWNDQSLNGYNAIQATAANQPVLGTSDFNFNPGLTFTGDDYLSGSDVGMTTGAAPRTMIGIAMNGISDGSWRYIFTHGTAGGAQTSGFGKSSSTTVSTHGWASDFSSTMPWTPLNYTQLQFGDYNGTQARAAVNGGVLTGVARTWNTVLNGNMRIGSNPNGGENWIGKIGEVIAYEGVLSNTDLQRVNSYLAIKYGVTLDQTTAQNYLASDGTTIFWDATANATYKNNIFGIGADLSSGLNQKQSTSVNTGFQPVLATAGFAANNAANTTGFVADKSFEMAGSDAGATSFGTAITAPTGSTANNRFTRIWKVQETGTVGTVKFAVPSGIGTGGTVYLVRSTDATFDATDTWVPLSNLTVGGTNYLAGDIDFANGDYFTIATYLTAPGCVTADLTLWYNPTFGVTTNGSSRLTNWSNVGNLANADFNDGTATKPTLRTATAAQNYNPYIEVASGERMWTGAVLPAGIPQTSFMAAKLTKIGSPGSMIYRNSETNSFTHYHGLGNYGAYNTVNLHIYSGAGVADRQNTSGGITNDRTSIYGARFKTGGGADAKSVSINGNHTSFTDNVTYDFSTDANRFLFGDDTWGNTGNVNEIILYNRELTNAERDRVNSYLGIKYGVTLQHNYLSGAGTTIYDRSTFANNIFGIGRDNCQSLQQKQSKSVNTTGKMTIGLLDTIAPSNATHPAEFSNDASFIMIGDNAATGVTTFSAGDACTPPSVDKYANLNYKIVETGDVQSIKVKFDASGLGFNNAFPAFMQVASDAAFTNMIANIPAKWSGSELSTNYNFPANATAYVRFSGNTTALANLCSGDKTINWYGSNLWNWGTRTKTIVDGDQTFTATITDANNNILYPSWYPVSYGNSIYIPRYDNDNTGKVVFKVTMSKPASSVSFPIYGVDWHWGLDKVNVIGKLSGGNVTAKLSKSPYGSWVNTSGTQAEGTNWLHAGYSHLGVTYANFDSPVDEITVEYTKTTTYPSWVVYNYIGIGAFDITCQPIVPEVVTPENVYLFKQAVAKTNKADESFTYKFTLQNNNCTPKTINLTDNLPATLTWVDSSLVTSATIGAGNNYGGTQNLSLTNITVPVGVSYIYLNAKGSTAGLYNDQATMVVSGGGTYLSDDPSVSGAENPTPVTLTAPDPLANLAITKAVDKATTEQGTVVTYTLNVTNSGGTSVNTTVEDNLMGIGTYVASSLTGAPVGSQVSAYGGAANLVMRDVTIAAGATVTMTVQVNVNQTPVDSFVYNVAKVTPDIASGFSQVTTTSNQVQTRIISTCVAGSAAPSVSTTLTNTCPTVTANLGSLIPSNKPAGTVLMWHTATPATFANRVADSSMVVAGTYYGAYYDAVANCFSNSGNGTTAVVVTITNPCPAVFTFNCGAASTSGTFVANGTGGQTGSVTIPMTGATAGSATFTVTGTGFTGTLNTTLTAGQTSVSVPITYDGTGAAGSRTLTVNSSQGTGTCTPSVSVISASGSPCLISLPIVLPFGLQLPLPNFCTRNGYNYYKSSPISTDEILAIHPNGNLFSPTSVNINATATGVHSYTLGGKTTALANRMVSILAPGSYTANGGMTVRIYYDATEFASLPTANRRWFKHPAHTKATVLADLSAAGLANATYLTPSSTGTENGVAYVEFNNITSFSTFGYAGSSVASFDFDCGAASTSGTFVANGTGGQTGSVTIPMTGATAGSATFTVTGTGFTGTLSTTLTAGQASVSVPITYDGTGAARTQALTITSTEGSGSCSANATVGSSAATFTFNCSGVSATGTYTANGTAGQTGSVVIPLTGATVGTATFSVVGTGFTGTLSTTLTAGQASVTIPITYNGLGIEGSRTLTVTSSQGTGSCTPSVSVTGIPDLTTVISQPATPFTAGQPSDVTLTLTNTGTGSAVAPITTTLNLPTGTSAPANFTSNGSTCSTSGQVVTCTNPGPIVPTDSIKIVVPVTPNASAVGSPLVFTGTTPPVTGETNTSNNNPPSTTSPIVLGIPDLTTTVGQPLTPLTVGQSSDLPITVTNVGSGSASGVITTTITLPSGVSAPATFTNNGWTCSTSTPSVICTNSGPIAAGANKTFNVPVTPNVTTVGTKPIFNATTAPVTGETNTGNNNAAPLTPSANVLPANCDWMPGTIGK